MNFNQMSEQRREMWALALWQSKKCARANTGIHRSDTLSDQHNWLWKEHVMKPNYGFTLSGFTRVVSLWQLNASCFYDYRLCLSFVWCAPLSCIFAIYYFLKNEKVTLAVASLRLVLRGYGGDGVRNPIRMANKVLKGLSRRQSDKKNKW